MARNRRKSLRFAQGTWVSRTVVVSAALVALTLGYVWLRVQKVQVGYSIRESEKTLAGLKKGNQIHRVKIAQLVAPRNVEARVREDLGLKVTTQWQLVVLPKTIAPTQAMRRRMPAKQPTTVAMN